MKTFNQILSDFRSYDIDHDGLAEIGLTFPPFEDQNEPLDLTANLVIVLINGTLLNSDGSEEPSGQDLADRLLRFKFDLINEGMQAKCVNATLKSVTAGQRISDGLTILALRDFLVKVRGTYPNLRGIILVGPFPDARMTHLNPVYHESQNANGTTDKWYGEDGFLYAGAGWDIAISDLDGNWPAIYRKDLTRNQREYHLSTNSVVSKIANVVTVTNPSIRVSAGQATLRDTFFVLDCAYSYQAPVHKVQFPAQDATAGDFDPADADREVGAVGKGAGNPLSTPSICISRINARHVAMQPPKGLIDASGKPQNVPCSSALDPNDPGNWTYDPNLERRLLIDYFDRNHGFRTGKYGVTSFSYSLLESANLGTAAADESVEGLSPRAADVTGGTVLSVVRWLATPFPMRVLSAHATSSYTQLLGESDSDALVAEQEAGGNAWRWVSENGQWISTFRGLDYAGHEVYRTLWENGKFEGISPSLMVHVGCYVNSINDPQLSYMDAAYGKFINADTLLFFGNQLALICHNAVWFRGPVGFGEGFGASDIATFGDGWKQFYKIWSQDSALRPQKTENKRPYEWAVVGDWTLRKFYPATSIMSDLIVASIDMPSRVVSGETIQIAVTIRNQGTEIARPSTGSVVFMSLQPAGRVQSAYFYVPAIDPGSSFTAKILRSFKSSGVMAVKYIVIATADVLDESPESDERNNTLRQSLTVTAKAPPVHPLPT